MGKQGSNRGFRKTRFDPCYSYLSTPLFKGANEGSDDEWLDQAVCDSGSGGSGDSFDGRSISNVFEDAN